MKKTSKYNKNKGLYRRRRIVAIVLLEFFIVSMIGIGYSIFNTDRTKEIISRDNIEFNETITYPVSVSYSSTFSYQKQEQPYLKETIPLTGKELINSYVDSICLHYPNVNSYLVKSIIQQESAYQPTVENGSCIGLMQISSYWHKNRMTKLGIKDLHDSYGNILVGVDYLNELFVKYKDINLVLMLYSMDNDEAFRLYKNGSTTTYVKKVLNRKLELENLSRG